MVISVSDKLYVLATSTNTELYFCTSCGTCRICGYLCFHLDQHPCLDQTTEILSINACPPCWYQATSHRWNQRGHKYRELYVISLDGQTANPLLWMPQRQNQLVKPSTTASSSLQDKPHLDKIIKIQIPKVTKWNLWQSPVSILKQLQNSGDSWCSDSAAMWWVT